MIGRPTQPTAPECDGLVEHRDNFVSGQLAWWSGRTGFQHHRADLARMQVRRSSNTVTLRIPDAVGRGPADRSGRMHRELYTVRPEDRSRASHIQGVGGAAVVEPRHTVEREAHLAAYHPDQPDQPMVVGGALRVHNRHEVNDFTHTGIGHETGDEYRAVGKVELFGYVSWFGWSNAKMSSFRTVEQRRENAR